MNSILAITAHYLFGWTVLTVSISWLAASVYPIIRRYMSTSSAVQGAFYTLLIAMLAPIIACVTLIILSFPTLAQSLVAPHCHDQLCEPHSFDFVVETIASNAVLALSTAGVLFVTAVMASQLIVNRQRAQTLEKLSQLDTSGYLCFESNKHIAWCFGLFKPKVFISSGLLESASKQQQQVILAHELARASRYDNLRKWLLNWVTLVWPKHSRRQIRQDFAKFCDSICDLQAFAALNKSMEISAFVDTLKYFYGDQQSTHNDSGNIWQQRLDTLQREWSSQQGKTLIINPQSLMLGTLTTLAGLLVVTISVFVGHPLLEILN